jgi:hypothetical protein
MCTVLLLLGVNPTAVNKYTTYEYQLTIVGEEIIHNNITALLKYRQVNLQIRTKVSVGATASIFTVQ